jgi:Outer membrane efflux protein
MEEQALLLRPELRAIDYKRRINPKEVKAVFLELFPSMKVSFGGYYNNNNFLLYQNWLTYAVQVSWNLLGGFKFQVQRVNESGVPHRLRGVWRNSNISLDAYSAGGQSRVISRWM